MHKFVTFSLALVIVTGLAGVVARPVEAAALSQVQIQAVLSLLESFGVDSTTVANVNAALTGSAVVTTPPTGSGDTGSTTAATAAMIGFLHRGDQGDQVKLLQTLLASDPSVYPEGLINGFFGALTQKALERYQEKHGLDVVGSVGPKTLHELETDLEDTPVALEDNSATSTDAVGTHHPCAIVPPGHEIAPGFLRKHDGEQPLVPPCQTLPPGIREHMGTSTSEHSATSTESNDN